MKCSENSGLTDKNVCYLFSVLIGPLIFDFSTSFQVIFGDDNLFWIWTEKWKHGIVINNWNKMKTWEDKNGEAKIEINMWLWDHKNEIESVIKG